MPDSRDPQLDDLRRRARRRLIGAIVLALAAVVLVPLLLESDPKPLGEDVAVKIPPISEGKFAGKSGERRKGVEPASATEAKVEAAPPVAATAAGAAKDAAKDVAKDAAKAPTDTPRESANAVPTTPMAKSLASAEQRVLAPPAKAVTAPVPAPAKAAAPSAAKDVVPAPAPKPAEPQPAPKSAEPQPAPKSAEPKAVEPKAAEADKGSGHAVQLAAFTDDKGANALAAKLKKSGYPAYTEPYDTSRGKLWRVRVGPYPSRDAAEEVRAKLKAEGQSGFIAAAK